MHKAKICLLVFFLFISFVLGTGKPVFAETISLEEKNLTNKIPTSASGNTVEDAINKANSGQIFEVEAIPPGDALVFVEKKFSQFYLFIKAISYHYEVIVIVIAGLVMAFPFKPKLKKYLGWTILGGGALGFFFIHFSPVIVGIFKGFTQP